MSNELKSCPFCGGEAEVYEYEAEHNIYDGHTLGYVDTVYYIKYGCACHECGSMIAEKTSKQKVIEAWNRRIDNA